MNAYSFDGALIAGLLLICTCAYLKGVPRISSWLLSEKKGFFGIFYKMVAVFLLYFTAPLMSADLTPYRMYK